MTVDLLASMQASVSYGTPGPAFIAPHPLVDLVPYTIVSKGVIAVANGFTAGDKSVPLNGIATEITGFMIRNRTRQDIEISINSETPAHTMVHGSVIMFAAPAGGATTPVTTLDLVTTITQVGPGEIDFWVFGDP